MAFRLWHDTFPIAAASLADKHDSESVSTAATGSAIVLEGPNASSAFTAKKQPTPIPEAIKAMKICNTTAEKLRLLEQAQRAITTVRKDTTLIDIYSSTASISILSNWLKQAIASSKSTSNDVALAIFKVIEKLPLTANQKTISLLDSTKLLKRIRKVMENPKFTERARTSAKDLLKILKLKKASEDPSNNSNTSTSTKATLQPLNLAVIKSANQEPISSMSVISSSPAFKKSKREVKRVSWGDQATPQPDTPTSSTSSRRSISDVYGGWGLIATKTIPNLEELRMSDGASTGQRSVLDDKTAEVLGDFAHLSAGGSPTIGPSSASDAPISPNTASLIAQERRMFEKQKRSSQLEALKESSMRKPWRMPRLLTLPEDVMQAIAPKTSWEPPNEKATIEIPLYPVTDKPTRERSPSPNSTTSSSSVKKPENDEPILYDPSMPYDPANIYEPVESNNPLSKPTPPGNEKNDNSDSTQKDLLLNYEGPGKPFSAKEQLSHPSSQRQAPEILARPVVAPLDGGYQQQQYHPSFPPADYNNSALPPPPLQQPTQSFAEHQPQFHGQPSQFHTQSVHQSYQPPSETQQHSWNSHSVYDYAREGRVSPPTMAYQPQQQHPPQQFHQPAPSAVQSQYHQPQRPFYEPPQQNYQHPPHHAYQPQYNQQYVAPIPAQSYAEHSQPPMHYPPPMNVYYQPLEMSHGQAPMQYANEPPPHYSYPHHQPPGPAQHQPFMSPTPQPGNQQTTSYGSFPPYPPPSLQQFQQPQQPLPPPYHHQHQGYSHAPY
jgi:hypothetical protein